MLDKFEDPVGDHSMAGFASAAEWFALLIARQTPELAFKQEALGEFDEILHKSVKSLVESEVGRADCLLSRLGSVVAGRPINLSGASTDIVLWHLGVPYSGLEFDLSEAYPDNQWYLLDQSGEIRFLKGLRMGMGWIGTDVMISQEVEGPTPEDIKASWFQDDKSKNLLVSPEDDVPDTIRPEFESVVAKIGKVREIRDEELEEWRIYWIDVYNQTV